MKIDYAYLSGDTYKALEQIEQADEYIRKGKPFFFIVRKGTFSSVELKSAKFDQKNRIKHVTKDADLAKEEITLPTRYQVLKSINRFSGADTVLLATTGKTGRELYEVEDRPGNLYMVGSMGCISSLGLGLALTKPRKKVIAIDGDGALIMRMGSLATNAYYHPDNLLHILIDNNAYDSTGGQLTVSQSLNFMQVASAAGYPVSVCAGDLDDFEHHLNVFYKNPVLTFICIRVQKGSKENLGRPGIKPHEVKDRLISFLDD